MLALIEKLIRPKVFSLPVERTLVVDLNYMGDVLMDTPVYRVLSHGTINAVDALVRESSVPVLHSNLYIDRVEVLRSESFLGSVWEFLKLWGRYDLVVHLNTSLRTNALIFLTGAKYRLGYNYKHRGCFCNVRVPTDRRTLTKGNRVDEVLRLISEALHFPIESRETVYTFNSSLLSLFAKNRMVALHCNTRSTQDLRRWPHFPSLADALHAKGYTIVFTGVRKDWQYIESLRRQMKAPSINACGVFELEGLAAFLSSCAFVVTVNTLTMHLAYTIKVPTVAIIGATPASVLCTPNPRFRYLENQYHIAEISVGEVLEEIEELLKEK